MVAVLVFITLAHFCIYRLRGFGVVVGRMLGFSPSSLQRLVLSVILSLYTYSTMSVLYRVLGLRKSVVDTVGCVRQYYE